MDNLSIIIITYNEEKNLPKLLQTIEEQDVRPNEIIVADSKSTDKTRQIARRFGCKVVEGGNGPSEARNRGAKYAKSPILLFLDADTLLPKGFLRYSIEYINKHNLDISTVHFKPDSDKPLDIMILGAYNAYQALMQYIWPRSVGACIFCKRRLFERIKGFDEKIILAEDQEFVGRASRLGKFRIIPKKRVSYSMRRFEVEGRTSMALKVIQCEIYRVFKGEIKTKVIKYEKRPDWIKRIMIGKKHKEEEL